jgi:hypothetical protein
MRLPSTLGADSTRTGGTAQGARDGPASAVLDLDYQREVVAEGTPLLPGPHDDFAERPTLRGEDVVDMELWSSSGGGRA